MGLLSDFTAYVDSLKRRGANTARELVADPMGLLGRNVSAFSESLPAAPGEPQNEMLARPGMQDWATGVAMNAPTMGLLGHTVYHGSPHKFDKFDASKIGTGEGAQAYGHGIYLAENPAVAKQYAADRSYVGKAMAGAPDGAAWDSSRIAKHAVDEHGDKAAAHLSAVLRANSYNTSAAPTAANKDVADAIAVIQAGKVERTGNLYKADLPDEWLPKMLDWDKPLSQQPEVVKRLAKEQRLSPKYLRATAGGFGVSGDTGGGLFRALQNEGMTPEQASDIVRQAGIPGIRYLDGGSRGAGEGSYNYVVFPGMEHLIKILERE